MGDARGTANRGGDDRGERVPGRNFVRARRDERVEKRTAAHDARADGPRECGPWRRPDQDDPLALARTHGPPGPPDPRTTWPNRKRRRPKRNTTATVATRPTRSRS